MGFNDRYPIDFSIIIEKCPKCGKEFEVVYEEQQPGFRVPSEKMCPYCKHLLAKSMEHEFTTRKL